MKEKVNEVSAFCPNARAKKEDELMKKRAGARPEGDVRTWRPVPHNREIVGNKRIRRVEIASLVPPGVEPVFLQSAFPRHGR